ncbi:MAG TPA: DUF72 domain-containing protein [Terriglobia bacterium]|nr:DUF72 domain-containing protein [Terriglobia bacterium]
MIYAGTSGFAYPSWKPRFYPAGAPAKKFLEYYARRLNSVEINYTFRRLAAESTLENWIKATPEGFLFAPKAHQRITHMLRLKDAAEFTGTFLHSLDPLRPAHRLGPVLFQLPPYLQCDEALLGDFLATLPGGLRYAFEFRHDSWFRDPVYKLLAKRNAALCWAESEKLEAPEVVTADFVYLRLRKPEYSAAERKAISKNAEKLLKQRKDVFVFFKHEETPDGALYAEELLHQR